MTSEKGQNRTIVARYGFVLTEGAIRCKSTANRQHPKSAFVEDIQTVPNGRDETKVRKRHHALDVSMTIPTSSDRPKWYTTNIRSITFRPQRGGRRNLVHQPFRSQGWSISNFPCSLTRNITSHSMKNLAFHSLLRWKMIILPILTTSLIHLSSKRLGERTFWTWEWKG